VLKEYRILRDKMWDLYQIPDERNPHCTDSTTPPTEEERYAAIVLHWLRNKKKELSWCMKHECYPSPKGFSTKPRGLWIPSPREACQADVRTDETYVTKHESNAVRQIPYAWWGHCKSYEHCLFLAQHRKRYFSRLIEPLRLARISAALSLGCVPILSASSDGVTAEFMLDWCAGKVLDPHKEESACHEKMASA
jgi:hypothetical protein